MNYYYYGNVPSYYLYNPYIHYRPNQYPQMNQCSSCNKQTYSTYRQQLNLKDYGPNAFVINIEKATIQNPNYRTTLWTGRHLQVTLMSISVGGDIGLEMHPDVDQFIRIEEGEGLVKMGDNRNNLNFQRRVRDDDIILIPAGKWHNLINNGNTPIKLYSIYAPPEHPHGTVHRTKAESDAEHH